MDQETLNQKLLELRNLSAQEGISLEDAWEQLQNPQENPKRQNLAWERVQKARLIQRPKPQEYIQKLFPDFIELHGDRLSGDDPAILGGLATFEGRPVTVIATRRGSDLQSNLTYRFGMPLPSGYRKAHRLMGQAEKFHRPVLLWIDTPGAYPGIESEDQGISKAIADNLLLLSHLKTPVLAIITGEGGSGGALALLIADRIAMLEHAVLSVITPEGCASILFKDASKAPEAAQHLGMDAQTLQAFGIVDHIIPEPFHPEKNSLPFTAIQEYLSQELNTLCSQPISEVLEARYQRLRRCGFYHE